MEHIKAVEAGSGKNTWVGKIYINKHLIFFAVDRTLQGHQWKCNAIPFRRSRSKKRFVLYLYKLCILFEGQWKTSRAFGGGERGWSRWIWGIPGVLIQFSNWNKSFNYRTFSNQAIIEDLQGAGWSIKRARENERISDLDLRHIFEKVDVNQDHYVNRMVGLCRKWRVEWEGKHLKCSGDENGLQISVQTIQLQLQKGKRKVGKNVIRIHFSG